MFHPEVLGYIAAFLTTAAFFPQTIKTIRTRDTKSISLAMYVLFTSGIALWLWYGRK
jgi:MtN3 and saliva related transmembrane protein